MSIWGYGRERHGILGNLLNTHSLALKHLMPALMHFYIGNFYLLLFSILFIEINVQRWNKRVQAHSFMINSVCLPSMHPLHS